MSGTDLRIQKTYAALTREFTALLKLKRFEQITVKELCDAAMVRTATFYNHFSDKYEFADFVISDAFPYSLEAFRPWTISESSPSDKPAFASVKSSPIACSARSVFDKSMQESV